MKKNFLRLFLICLLTVPSSARPGEIDLGFDAGSRLNGWVNCAAIMPDGKIVIAGGFTTVAGAVQSGLARLNRDGSVDISFKPEFGPDAYYLFVSTVPERPGKVYVFGSDDRRGLGLRRLNSDGSLDPFFRSEVETSWASLFFVQGDGKILCYGNSLLRLHADGKLDPSFTATLDVGGPVSALGQLPDGRVVVAGNFRHTHPSDGIARNHIVRVNSDGSFDHSFVPELSASDVIGAVAAQPDGKLIVGLTGHEVSGRRVMRLNPNGTLDKSFAAAGFTNLYVSVLALQADGKILVGGGNSLWNGPSVIVDRLNPDGSFDTTFSADPKFNRTNTLISRVENGWPRTMTLDSENKILLSGSLGTHVSSTIVPETLARLDSAGTIDPTFFQNSGPNAPIACATAQKDGKIIVGGAFTKFYRLPRKNLARLESNGNVDPSFVPTMAPTINIAAVAVQQDGKILAAGSVEGENALDWQVTVFRLNPDGSQDSSFRSELSGATGIKALLPDKEGRILASGFFEWNDRVSWRGLIRLNANGSLDAGFSSPPNTEHIVPIVLQDDGKILTVLQTNVPDGSFRSQIARLNADGSLDQTFKVDALGAWQTVSALALQAGGKMLVGGRFTEFSGSAATNLVRLNPDGSFDPSFQYSRPGDILRAADPILSIALQNDGKIVLGLGETRHFGTVGNVVRLGENGALDPTFERDTEADRPVSSVSMLPNGDILASGDFSIFGGVPRSHLALLRGDRDQLMCHQQAGRLILSWTDPTRSLQFAPSLNSQFATIPGATSPHTNNVNAAEGFFRLQAH